MFSPKGIAPRKVRLWIDPKASEAEGPVVFYWHGTGSAPTEALTGLGQAGIDAVTAAGGIVAAPHADPAAAPSPWWLVLTEKEDDLLLADEVLACAIQEVGIDVRRIHSMGLSAGGLHTSQMSVRRSSYVASVVPYSGGLLDGLMPPWDAPS
ncbi:MAG: hypothetical protein IPK80_01070 [Nannocystis sp.]|nr:hypothetical protein [Nannocystis sp.]